MKYLDPNGDGRFNGKDLATIFSNDAIKNQTGIFLGLAMYQTDTTLDDELLTVAADVLSAARLKLEILTDDNAEVSRRDYIGDGIQLLKAINDQANDESPVKRYTTACLVGAQAMHDNLDLTDGAQVGEVSAAISAMIMPILAALFSGAGKG